MRRDGWSVVVTARAAVEEDPEVIRGLSTRLSAWAPGFKDLWLRLPLERGIWVDSGRTASEAAALMDTDRLRGLAMETAVAHAARLLAVYPPGEFSVHVIDPARGVS